MQTTKVLINFLMKNHQKIRVTKRDYVNKFLIPIEKSATYKDIEPMFKESKDFYNQEEAIKFITGKTKKLILNDSYDFFTLYA